MAPHFILNLLCVSFLFVDAAKFVKANKTKGYSTRYINDFNGSSSFEPIYDYDNTKTEIEKVPIQQDATKNDEIYPDPEDFHKKLLNKSRLGNQNHGEDASVIKIFTTRVRQSKKDKRLNQNQSNDINNDDLNGHDFIDSIMFIYYYGKNVRSWKDLGGNILILGGGFSMFAQILTIILVSLRSSRMRNNAFFPITMNLLVMLFLSNLLFIVGVQSNKNALRCEVIALLLHYLYLTTSVWCFIFIFIIYDLIINESLRLKMRFILLIAYAIPAIYVLFSYAASTNSLEYQKYCFMSIQKNMIINFLIPIFILIVLTTTFGTICLKHIKSKNRDILCESIDSTSHAIATGIILNNGQNIDKFITDKEILASYYLKTSSFTNQLKCCEDQHEENYFKSKTDIYDSKFDVGQMSLADISESSSTNSSSHDYTNFKNATKFALFFQPVFAICWFVGVLALENIHSYVFPTVFAISYNILNWSILLKSRNTLPFMKHLYETDPTDVAANEQCSVDDELDEDQLARKDSKNMKNNKNLLNQLFLNSATESSVLTSSGTIQQRNDQIPLLYQSHYNHRKSIANLELTHAEYHIEKHKVNSRSEHDLVYQQKQQQFGKEMLLANGKIDNVIGCMSGIRSSWDNNLDRVSTISN